MSRITGHPPVPPTRPTGEKANIDLKWLHGKKIHFIRWDSEPMIKTNDFFLILLSLAILIVGIGWRMRLWRIGTDERYSGSIKSGLKDFIIEGIFHKRILEDFYPGFIHLLVFIGFVIPLLIVMVTQFRFTLPLLLARLISFFLDLIALAAVAGVILALYRRLVSKPDRLDNRADDFTVLTLILLILLTGLLMEALRLSVIGRDGTSWAPVGHLLAAGINLLGFGPPLKRLLSMVVFRVHFFLVLGTIAYIPFSKLFHLISSPLNMIFRSTRPKGELKLINLEDETAETFGISQIQEFSWKQLMDLDACTRCGRCQDHCPAYLTQKPLSPKKFINDLKDYLHRRGSAILQARRKGMQAEDVPQLIGNVLKEEEVWACTTCRSCTEHCPVYVEHVDKILDLRRYKVLMEGQFPEELKVAFKGLETNSNPWGMGQSTRGEWISELDVPVLSEIQDKSIDLLFFVGCLRSYDDRNKNVAKAMVKILKHLGIKFAILGAEEGCCGDPARRAGNEYLYQMLAQTNIDVFRRYNVNKILTTCPHCYNTLKVEYPQLGFQADVIHHAEFLKKEIEAKRISMSSGLPDRRITYHDPCYLGRYSGIYEAPRDILRAAGSLDLVEMDRSRRDSFCCGAGGSWMWLDEKTGERINHRRLKDALETKPDWITTACPFCVIMFSDAVKDNDLEDRLKVWDIAEVVEMALFREK
jgi:Fe-S oxidoreductase/nitrate reductase gamma subunit